MHKITSGWINTLPLFFILLLPISGDRLGAFFLISLLLFLALNLRSIRKPSTTHWVFIALLSQYLVFHLLKVFLSDGNLYVGHPASDPKSWALALLAVPLIYIYVSTFEKLKSTFEFLVPATTALCILTIGYHYFFGDSCRVRISGNLFFPSLVLATLSFFWAATFGQKSVLHSRIAALLIAASLISSANFFGTRGIFLSELAVLGLGIALLAIQKSRYATGLFIVVIASLVIAVAIDYFAQCNFFLRSTRVISLPAEITAADNSAGMRLDMWANALETIRLNPLFGTSMESELNNAIGPHRHVHNMYLSWAIWGGIVSLISGILFLSALPIALGKRSLSTNTTLVHFSLSGMWALAMLFDSFLVWPLFLTSTVLLSFIALGLTFDDEG